MKKFILKCFSFLLFIVGLSFILDYMIQEGLKTSNYREITKWNEVILGGIDAEIVIVGSSRALVHFDCEYIQRVTGKRCYNLGFDGTNYPLQKLMLELYLSKNQKPKEIIWSLDYHSFSYSSNFYGFEQLIPYRDNLFIRKILSLHETPNYQFDIPLFRYSFNPKMKVIGLFSFIGIYNRKPILKNGFRKQDKGWDGSFEEFKRKNSNGFLVNFDEKIFKDFIDFNRELKNKVKINWVASPYFIKYDRLVLNRIEIQSKWYENSNKLDIPLINLSNSFISKEQINFYNSTHLNKFGVEKFMIELSKLN